MQTNAMLNVKCLIAETFAALNPRDVLLHVWLNHQCVDAIEECCGYITYVRFYLKSYSITKNVNTKNSAVNTFSLLDFKSHARRCAKKAICYILDIHGSAQNLRSFWKRQKPNLSVTQDEIKSRNSFMDNYLRQLPPQRRYGIFPYLLLYHKYL